MRLNQGCWLLGAVAFWALSGCGSVLETRRVSSRFESLFSCSKPKVSAESGGYRAEGCGVVAHFACFDDNPRDSDESSSWTSRDSRSKASGGEVAGAMVSALLLVSLDTKRCVLDHSERVAAPTSNEPAAALTQHVAPEGGGPTLRLRMPVAGGHLEVVGKPALHPRHVLFALHSSRRLPSDGCSSQLFHDGAPIRIDQAKLADAFRAYLVVPVSELKDVDQAARFAGSVCGWELELDDASRQSLGRFEARFREEVVRMGGASSGGEAPQTPAEAGR